MLPSPLGDGVGHSNHDRFRGYLSVHLRSGLQFPCLRFATAVTGRHARLGTRLLARLCRGCHFRRLCLTSFQGATPTDPDVRVLPHPAPRQTASLRAIAYPLVQEARRWPPPSLTARGESPASHRDPAESKPRSPRARCEEGKYREYLTHRGPRPAPPRAGWIGGRMQRDFHHGLLRLVWPVRLSVVVTWRRGPTAVCWPSFPPTVPPAGAPFPPRGLVGSIPPLRRYYETLRLLAAHPPALRCLRPAVPSEHLRFAPSDARCDVHGLGLGEPVPAPRRSLRWRRRGLPGSRETHPHACHALRPRQGRCLHGLLEAAM